MLKRVRMICTLIGPSLFVGCPGDADPNASAEFAAAYAGTYAAISTPRGGTGGATAEPPPPPSLKKLCSLEFGRTSFDAAKKMFGEPIDESMDKSNAGLSYRYKGKDGTVTLLLTFAWSDGEPGVGTIIFKVGGSPEDFIEGYLLSEASLTGMSYPGCWPHEEQ